MKKIKGILWLLIVLFIDLSLTNNVFAQTLTLQGYVKDAKTNASIPYANIYIKKGNIGTSTNTDGFFMLKVPKEFQNDTLMTSYIGFESYKIAIYNIKNRVDMIILLKEPENTLEEVTISASSPAQIIAKAYQNIPINYPLTNTLYTGFYRESNLHHKKDSAEKYFYVIEAVTKLNKPSYEKQLPEGDVKITEVRKNQFVKESIKFQKWIAGAFTPIRFDVAKKRFDFVQPEKQYRYTYTLEDYTTYYDREVYKISFKPSKNSADYQGIIYIDTETYAIVKVDYQYSEAGLRRENSSRSYADLIKRQFKINYQPIGNKWYVQTICQQAEGYDKPAKDYYRYVTEYATTRIDTNTYEKFEYADKIQFNDIFLTKNDAYNENFWKDYNIIPETKDYKEILIDTTYQLNIKKQQKTTNLSFDLNNSLKDKKPNKRFRLSYSISPTLIKSSANQIAIQYTNETGSFGFNEQMNVNATQIAWSSGFGIEYDIYKNFYANLNFQFGFSKLKYNFTELSLGYRFPLHKEKKRPMYLYFENTFAFANLIKRVKDFDNTSATKIEVEAITFDKDKVQFELQNRQFVIKPKIGFLLEINRRLFSFAEVGCLIPVSNQERLVFLNENNNGLLGTIGLKKSEVSLSNPRVDFRADRQNTNRLPFTNFLYFNVGIKGFLSIRL